MKRGIQSFTVVVAMIALWGGASAASAAETKLTIDPSEDAVGFRGKVSITGKLTAAEGVTAADHEVRLYEKHFPYKRSGVIATTTTDANGGYRFADVEPEYNARYRVTINDETVSARSASKLVSVGADVSLKTRASRGGEAVSSFRFRYSSKLPLQLGGREILWYFHRIGAPLFVVRDHTRSKETSPGVVRGRSRFDLPPGSYRFEVSFCLDPPNKRDIGLGQPTTRRDCPRSFPADNGRSSAGRQAASGAFPTAALLPRAR